MINSLKFNPLTFFSDLDAKNPLIPFKQWFCILSKLFYYLPLNPGSYQLVPLLLIVMHYSARLVGNIMGRS